MEKPSIFVGSSTEGRESAHAVRALLDQDAKVTVWDEGFFGAGSVFIDALVNALPRFDFAILIVTPDDLIHSRDAESFGPRDNIIFELGLFMGRLGRERTVILRRADATLKIPTDLSGVTMDKYNWPRTDGSHISAVGAACDTTRRVIRDLGLSAAKTEMQVRDIRLRQETTEARVRAIQIVIKGLVTEFEYQKLLGLTADGPFNVHFHKSIVAELNRLDAIRYVRPRRGYGIESIRERDGTDRRFDLKQYVETDEGLEYVKLRSGMLQSIP